MSHRVQGWMKVADKATLDMMRSLTVQKRRKLGRKRKLAEGGDCTTTQSVWQPCFCSLHLSERTLTHSLSERKGSRQSRGRTLNDLRLRLERGRRLGGSGHDIQTPSPLTEEDDSELSETTSLRDDRLLLRSAPSSSSTTNSGLLQPPSSAGSADENPKRHTIGFAVIPDLECPTSQTSQTKSPESTPGTITARMSAAFRDCLSWIADSDSSYCGSSSSKGSSYDQSPVGTPDKTMDVPTPSRFANFFSKRTLKNVGLKRTKSVTKLERKRCALDSDAVNNTQLRGSRSHESLLQSSPSVLGTVDLSAGDIKVSSVHNSLLDQNYCFQLTSKDGTTYYSCQTNQEREKWIHNLQQTIQPNRDHERRTEKSLHIWLLEAKGISGKKKYFCELCLDKTLYARTSSKLKNDLCFWGEHFEFNNLPQLDTITVNLYREADKKKRRDKNILIGTAVIPTNSLNNHHITEKWYPIFAEKGSSSKECPSIRVKSRFMNLTILPFEVYSDFLQYLKTNYKSMCEILEPAVSVRTKEDIATSLIYIMEKENMAKTFLTDIVMREVEKNEDSSLMFRGNSTATKAIEAYMKLIGEKYLQDTLGEIITSLTDSQEECEVDPVKVPNPSVLVQHQNNLINNVEMVWNKITASASSFPVELRQIFSECRQQLADKGKDEEVCDNLISASVFLRFLCPAILSPSLFNLAQEYPQGKTARNLTLIAKSIQTFANFTRFGGKESFMEFMNEFLEREWASMNMFLKEISELNVFQSPVVSQPHGAMEFDGHIDEGRELAILHNLLVDATSKIAEQQQQQQDLEASAELEKLQSVLDGISAALSQPVLSRQLSSPVPPSPSASDRLTTSSAPEKSNIPAPHRSSTMPRTFLPGGIHQPASDLNSTDDYVVLSAIDADQLSPRHKSSKMPRNMERDLPHITQSRSYIHPSTSAFQQATRLHAARRSFNATPRSAPTDSLRYSRRRLWKHAEDTRENPEFKHSHFSSLPIQQFTARHSVNSQSPTDSMSSKSMMDSPRLAPLAFNNPLYQHRIPGYSGKSNARNSPLSSFSSESDEEISVLGRTCLGSAESEPALALHSQRCCTSSSSTDTNSCESPPLQEAKNKVSKHPDDSYNLLKHHDRYVTHPSRSSSDTCSFEPKQQQVHRSSTDSGLHKSFRASLKSSQYMDYTAAACAAQDRKLDLRSRKIHSKSTVDEYEHQVRELRLLMGQLQTKLHEAELKLNSQEGKTEAALTEWKKRMEAEEEKLKKQQEEKDQQMKSIITRLITVEEELRREQKDMQALIEEKERIIEAQEKKILTLDATNAHLLAVLSQLRAQCPLQGQNGSTPTLKNSYVHRDPLFKSSSC